ncbi:MAG TPA: hypothetical protein VKX49_28380 [Bryobacteraceae bacterium]|nr:hypothetical protein [Bryobacteraceae bacterium]
MAASMPMPSVAPLFIEDQQRTSVITMVNDAPDPLGLDVLLYSLSGLQLAKQAVSLQPHSQQVLAVASLLQASGNQYGSVVLMPHRATTMAAQLSISGRNGTEAGDIEEEFQMLMSPKPANYRAVSLSASPVVAITSLSATKQAVSVSCLGGGNPNVAPLSVGPNQTLLVDACAKGGPVTLSALPPNQPDTGGGQQPAAVTVSSSAPSMELAVFGVGLVPPASKGHLAAIPFADVNGLQSSTALYPGVSGAGLDWSAFRGAVANFGAQERQATVLLSQGAGPAAGTQRTLATIKLAPHTVSLIDGINQLNGVNSDASLVIATNGAPGEVLSGIQAGRASASSGPVALPWKDAAQSANGGQHPWRTDLGATSTLILYNPDSSQQASLPVTIYSGTSAWTKTISIGPLSTVPIRINDIVNGQEPDDHGYRLSAGASQGIVHWFTLMTPKIVGFMLQSDPATGVARPFACASITMACAMILPNATIPVGGSTGNLNPIVSTCGSNGGCTCSDSCGGTGGNLATYAWSSSNSNIALLTSPPNANYGVYQGAGIGIANAFLSATDNNGCAVSSNGGGEITVQGQVQISSTTNAGQNNIHLNSLNGPNCGIATVQVYVNGLNTGLTPPTVSVSMIEASSNPPGFTVSIAPLSPDTGQETVSSSPGTFTFNVCATGGSGTGSVVVQAAINGVSPANQWQILSSSNTQATFNVFP